MGKLMQSLGLSDVSANVNEIPDGKYDAIVTKSEWFFNEAKNNVSHVLTYTLDTTDPALKGKSKQEFYTLGTDPVQADGSFATSEENLHGYKNTMTEQNRQFYKKRQVDLLAENNPESRKAAEAKVDAGQVDVGDFVGTKCTITVKTKDGWQNVSAAWRRDQAAVSAATPQAVTLGGTTPTPAPAPTEVPANNPAVPSGITGIAGGLT